jgi:sec-independent protein translocase protein TatB
MGFFEILLIAVVALMVVGPQRMPEAVRTVALTVGRFKRSLNSARVEIEKQIGTDDIRRQLHNEQIMDNLSKVQHQVDEVEKAFQESEGMSGKKDNAIDADVSAKESEPDSEKKAKSSENLP